MERCRTDLGLEVDYPSEPTISLPKSESNREVVRTGAREDIASLPIEAAGLTGVAPTVTLAFEVPVIRVYWCVS